MAINVSNMGINIIEDVKSSRLNRILKLDEKSKLPLISSSELLKYTKEEIAIFCHKNAYYQLPTIELIDKLKEYVVEGKTIEIGSGSGNIGLHLNIPMTDSFQQEKPEYVKIYNAMGQPCVNYGKDVEKIDAISAIMKYKPEVVIGCWVTHKYDAKYHNLGGNVDGINENLFKQLGVKKYIFVGNRNVHKSKILFNKKNSYKDLEIIQFDGIVSRSLNQEQNFLAVIYF